VRASRRYANFECFLEQFNCGLFILLLLCVLIVLLTGLPVHFACSIQMLSDMWGALDNSSNNCHEVAKRNGVCQGVNEFNEKHSTLSGDVRDLYQGICASLPVIQLCKNVGANRTHVQLTANFATLSRLLRTRRFWGDPSNGVSSSLRLSNRVRCWLLIAPC
jgi:hypothetical protein